MQIAADGGSHFWMTVLNGAVQAEDRKLIMYHHVFFCENKKKARDSSPFYSAVQIYLMNTKFGETKIEMLN